MAIGLLILAGTLTFTAQGREALRQREQRAQLLEQARAALAFIEADLQMAGFYGLTNRGGDFAFMQGGAITSGAAALSQDAAALSGLAAGAQTCGRNFAVDIAVPVQASDGAFTVGNAPAASCAPRGGAVAGSDTLIVRRAAGSAEGSAAGRLQLFVDRVDPARRALFGDAVLPAGALLQPGLIEVHALVTRIFYVSRDSEGQSGLPALRVKTLTSVAGQPAFVDTEVMPGIEDLQVQMLLDGGWVVARRPAPTETVRAVRVALRARGQDAASSTPVHVDWSRTVLLRDAPQ